MRYRVDWAPDVLTTLAAVWLQAPDRQAVTAAQARIDELLAMDPLGNSVSSAEGLYAIEVRPLRAQFELSEDDRSVRVVALGRLV